MSKQSCKPSDEQLVLSARSGDTDALAQLIVRFLPDIQAKAGCYKLAGLEPEDPGTGRLDWTAASRQKL